MSKRGGNSSSGGGSRGQASEWIWDSRSRQYYYIDGNGERVYAVQPQERDPGPSATSVDRRGSHERPSKGYTYGLSRSPPKSSSTRDAGIDSLAAGMAGMVVQGSSAGTSTSAASKTSTGPHRPSAAIDKATERPLFARQNEGFFRRGRVFAAPPTLASAAAASNASYLSNLIPQGAQDSTTRVQRFVVILEYNGYCTALPISSYGGVGVARRGVVKRDHSIIYIGRTAPVPSQNERPRRREQGMLAAAIKVDPYLVTERLDTMSRINYKELVAISHTAPVYEIGLVHRDSEVHFWYQFQAVQNPRREQATYRSSEGESSSSESSSADDGDATNSTRQAQPQRPPSTTSRSRPQTSSEKAAEARQIQAAFQRLRSQGSTNEESLRALARTLQGQHQQMTAEEALTRVRAYIGAR